MPIYEFSCPACGRRFEAIRRMGDDGEGLSCPDCGASPVEKVWSTFASPGSCGGGGFT